MKLRVVRRDGSIETISAVGPAEIHHGEGMDHLHSADGMDHYFLHDGTYDGWGMDVSGQGIAVDPEEPISGGVVGDIIERIERERKIEP